MVGDERHAAAEGPPRLTNALGPVLEGSGVGLTTERVDRETPFRDSASASATINRRLAAAVAEAVARDAFPLVLAGSCDACLGTLAALDEECGVVWLDAHGDFNTPESTVSGFFAGMSLAMIVGHCYRDLWSAIGREASVPEEAVLLLGVRDLSPAKERERLERSRIRVVPWKNGQPEGDPAGLLDELAADVTDVYLHIDLDVLDPGVAPGVVDDPVPGGMSLEQAAEIVSGAGERFRIRAAAVTTYTPALDPDERTLQATLTLVGSIADAWVRRSRSRTGTSRPSPGPASDTAG